MSEVLALAQRKIDAKRSTPPTRSYDAAELLATPMAEPNYVVRPFVPEGVTLWCGRPKAGKTTALRQLAHAVNSGGTFLGEQAGSYVSPSTVIRPLRFRRNRASRGRRDGLAFSA